MDVLHGIFGLASWCSFTEYAKPGDVCVVAGFQNMVGLAGLSVNELDPAVVLSALTRRFAHDVVPARFAGIRYEHRAGAGVGYVAILVDVDRGEAKALDDCAVGNRAAELVTKVGHHASVDDELVKPIHAAERSLGGSGSVGVNRARLLTSNPQDYLKLA